MMRTSYAMLLDSGALVPLPDHAPGRAAMDWNRRHHAGKAAREICFPRLCVALVTIKPRLVQCDCDCATPCPQGRTGTDYRCSIPVKPKRKGAKR